MDIGPEFIDKKRLEYKTDRWRYMWRPFMAYSYGLICIFDFMATPLIYFLVQYAMGTESQNFIAYTPYTLGGNGLFHVAMGAIVGSASWGRVQEKLKGVAGTIIEKDTSK